MSDFRSLPLAALLGCSMVISVAVHAAEPDASAAATPSAKGKKPKGDPNEVVCRREGVVGSRLQTQKICMTRSEWAEARRLQRADVERRQVQRGSAQQ